MARRKRDVPQIHVYYELEGGFGALGTLGFNRMDFPNPDRYDNSVYCGVFDGINVQHLVVIGGAIVDKNLGKIVFTKTQLTTRLIAHELKRK